MRVFLLALLLGVAACGESATEPPPSATGTWQGATGPQTLRLTLSEGAGGLVTGNGSLVGAESIALTVTSGTHVPPNVSLVLHATGYEDMSLQGTLTAAQITATIHGSGFTGDPITLTRQ